MIKRQYGCRRVNYSERERVRKRWARVETYSRGRPEWIKRLKPGNNLTFALRLDSSDAWNYYQKCKILLHVVAKFNLSVKV